MASPVSRPVFDDIAQMTTTFKQVMLTGKGPIAPRLTDEQIALIFAYGQSHYEEMSAKENGFYHLRPSETGLARSVTWLKDEYVIDLFLHCNKFDPKTGGDLPLCSDPVHSEKQLSYAYSCLKRMVCVSGAIKCFISDRLDLPFSSAKVEYALGLQQMCGGSQVAPISDFGLYELKEKERKIPQFFSEKPTHKFRFFMKLARCDLFAIDRGRLTLSQKVQLAYYLLTAVKSLHDNGVAHCDIKLENILLYRKLEDLSLTDFGAAIAEEDIYEKIQQQMSFFCLDPDYFLGRSPTFNDLKALDIWQSALIISEVFGLHPLHALFPELSSQPTMDRLTPLFAGLQEGWYSKNYRASLNEDYSDNPEIIEPLVALLDHMLHPWRSERPDIDECIGRMADLFPKGQDTAAQPKS